MKTIVINHAKCSIPKVGFFGRTIKQDYETPLGIVRETAYLRKPRIPTYKLLATKEPVKVIFDFECSDL